MSSEVRLRGSLLAGAAVCFIAAGLQLPGASQAEREARASARLVVDRPEVYPYDQDALGRESVLLTFAAMASDPAFVRQAATQRNLSAHDLRDVRVDVTNTPRSALITFTVRGPDRVDVRGLVLGVRTAAITRVNTLAPLYQLRPEPAGPPVRVSGGGSSDRGGPIALAGLAGLLVLAAAWLKRPAYEAPTRPSGAGS